MWPPSLWEMPYVPPLFHSGHDRLLHRRDGVEMGLGLQRGVGEDEVALGQSLIRFWWIGGRQIACPKFEPAFGSLIEIVAIRLREWSAHEPSALRE